MLTRKELAERLKVTTRTVDRQTKNGMPHIRFGKSVRFELNDVMAWVKEQNEKQKKGE